MNENKENEVEKMLLGHWVVGVLFEEGALHDGIRLGMGTGSTVHYAIEALARLMVEEEFKDIAVVPTSRDTLEKCRILNIPTYSLDSERIAGHLDIAIDGADRVDENSNLIKGGGAALFREKVIAYNCDLFVVIVDDKKRIKSLNCDFPLPVEILPFAYKCVALALEMRGLSYKLRKDVRTGKPFITENGNYILDVTYPKDFDLNPAVEEEELNKIVGVVENGFFTKLKKVKIFSVSEKDAGM